MLKSNCTSESMVTALTPIKTYRKYFIKIKKKTKNSFNFKFWIYNSYILSRKKIQKYFRENIILKRKKKKRKNLFSKKRRFRLIHSTRILLPHPLAASRKSKYQISRVIELRAICRPTQTDSPPYKKAVCEKSLFSNLKYLKM